MAYEQFVFAHFSPRCACPILHPGAHEQLSAILVVVSTAANALVGGMNSLRLI
jgi:hypothetical protein